MKCFLVKKKKKRKKNFLCKNRLSNDVTIFSHSGKMNRQKKTIELIKIFTNTKQQNWRLFIAGEFDDSISIEANELINKDSRIIYLGFLDLKNLTDLLCATDLYMQPLSPSQTAQTAMGCLTPVMLANINDYIGYEESGSIYINNTNEISDIFDKINKGQINLKEASQKTEKFAIDNLNYINAENNLFK